MKTKHFISALACIISLCSTTLLPANADESKKNWKPIRSRTDTELTIQEDGYYQVTVVDTTTGEILETLSGYYPAGTTIPIPSAAGSEVVFVKKIATPGLQSIIDELWME